MWKSLGFSFGFSIWVFCGFDLDAKTLLCYYIYAVEGNLQCKFRLPVAWNRWFDKVFQRSGLLPSRPVRIAIRDLRFFVAICFCCFGRVLPCLFHCVPAENRYELFLLFFGDLRQFDVADETVENLDILNGLPELLLTVMNDDFVNKLP